MSASNLPKTELTTLDSKWTVDCVVKVKAQVMTRDEGTGMWVPMSGGGMSVVSLHRVLARCVAGLNDDADDAAYVILGQRIADKSMALHCELLSDLEYTSVNPTFHHWTTNRKRFGLTFQTSSDATAFQKSIQRLLTDQNMRQGPVDSKAQLHMMAEEVLTVLQQVQISTVVDSDKMSSPPPCVFHRPPPLTRDSSSHAPIHEEQDHPPAPPRATPRPPQCITPNIQIKHHHQIIASPPTASTRDQPEIPPNAPPRLPLEHTSPQPPPTDSSTGVSLGDYGYYVDVTPNSGVERAPDIWLERSAKDLGRKVGLLALPADEADDLIYFSGSYVHFARNANPETHDYCYPSLDAFGTPPYGAVPPAGPPRSSGDPRRSHLSTSVPVPLPIKTRRKWLRRKKSLPSKSNASKSSASKSSSTRHRPQGPKLRCVYCDEYFSWDENRRGSCRDAPDRVLACIKAATCVCCQEAVAYHCHGNEEGDSEDSDRLDCGASRRGSVRRRAVLILICLVVPCLWCYLPFRTCHRLGVACGCCGPRHKAA